MKLSKRLWFAFFYGLIFSFYSFRAYFQRGFLPGDNYDARTITTNLEHWWYFYQGKESLRNFLFFAPQENILGGSETFFVQGLPYSFLRLIGINQTYSWFFANFVILTIGATGLFLVLCLVLRDRILVVCAATLILFSYQINIQLSHPQTFSFLLVSWWFYFLMKLFDHSLNRNSLLYFLFWSALLPLTSLYTFFAAIIIGTSFAVFTFLSDRFHFKKSVSEIRINVRFLLVNSLAARLALSFPVLTFSLFIYIYWEQYLRNQFGSFNQVSFYFPRLFDLVNASIGASGYSGAVYSWSNLGISGSYERAMGFPLLFSGLIVFVLGTFLFQAIKLALLTRIYLLCAIFLTFLPIADERGQSLWYFLWLLPGGESVRAPARFWVFAQILWVIAAMLIARQIILGLKVRRSIVYVVLLSITMLISIDQYRPSLANWNGKLLTIFGQEAESSLIDQDCAVFYLGTQQELTFEESLNRQIDGMVLAYKLGIPTVNGYSSNFPEGWPQVGAWGIAPADTVLEWIRTKSPGRYGTFCYYSEKGLSRFKLLD